MKNHIVYLIYYKNVQVYVGSSMNTKDRFSKHKWNILIKHRYNLPVRRYLQSQGVKKIYFQ